MRSLMGAWWCSQADTALEVGALPLPSLQKDSVGGRIGGGVYIVRMAVVLRCGGTAEAVQKCVIYLPRVFVRAYVLNFLRLACDDARPSVPSIAAQLHLPVVVGDKRQHSCITGTALAVFVSVCSNHHSAFVLGPVSLVCALIYLHIYVLKNILSPPRVVSSRPCRIVQGFHLGEGGFLRGVSRGQEGVRPAALCR